MRTNFFSTISRRERAAARRSHVCNTQRDQGLTMMEILISMIISGTLVTTMAFAYSTFLRTYPQALNRVAVSKDITFVQAWLPVDLASAILIDSDPTLQPATSMALPGTNVMSITRVDLQDPTHPEYLVNYRFELNDGAWVLVRYEIRNVGNVGGPEEIVTVGVAHELAPPPGWNPDTGVLAPPPVGWDPTTAPTFAIDVTGRNPGQLRKVGNDVTVTFVDGTTYDTGGAGLGPGAVLGAVSGDGFVNPTSPPSRCGGRMTLVLDTSGSLQAANVLKVKNAAKDFVDAFQGTPTELRILEFENMASPIAPANWSDPSIDMLNLTPAGVTATKAQISTIAEDGYGGTNWEDALRRAITDYSDVNALNPIAAMPDTVVFFTDGEPKKYTTSSGSASSTNETEALNQAKAVSNKKGEWGVTFKGVFVPGPGLQSSGAAAIDTAAGRLKQIVGDTEWSAPSGGVGNADAASFFYTTDFTQLTNIFQQIFVSDCGGTITVQRRENNDPNDPVSTGSYEYATSNGNGVLKAAETQSITFDYELDSSPSEWVTMVETGSSGQDIVDVRCYHYGNDVTSSRVRELLDESGAAVTSGREINVVANEALSCLFIGA